MEELLNYLKEDVQTVLVDIKKNNTQTSDFNYHLEMLYSSISAYLAETYSKTKRTVWETVAKKTGGIYENQC